MVSFPKLACSSLGGQGAEGELLAPKKLPGLSLRGCQGKYLAGIWRCSHYQVLCKKTCFRDELEPGSQEKQCLEA